MEPAWTAAFFHHHRRSPRLLRQRVYDLIIFSVVRVQSLTDLGISSGTADAQDGVWLLNVQMGGMLGAYLLERAGRPAQNGFHPLRSIIALFAGQYRQCSTNAQRRAVRAHRFIAGFGLAGEIGAGITLVAELLPKTSAALAPPWWRRQPDGRLRACTLGGVLEWKPPICWAAA